MAVWERSQERFLDHGLGCFSTFGMAVIMKRLILDLLFLSVFTVVLTLEQKLHPKLNMPRALR